MSNNAATSTEEQIRNVAIIAHVDHGKTTLVDQLMYQSGRYRNEQLDKMAGGQHGLVFDSNDLERERGITIFSKNCAIDYLSDAGSNCRINLIDTPGHADFGGEVERVLMMADGALLVVDAYEGPMPQTRFVLQKALAQGLRPIVVVNKIDRPDSRPDEVVTEVFDLLVDLGADDETLDFPLIFASAKQGWAANAHDERPEDMRALLEKIIASVPAPEDRSAEPTQMLVTTIDFSEFVGRVAIGRVRAGKLRDRQKVTVIDRHGESTTQQIGQLFTFDGLDRKQATEIRCGDICAVVGLDPVSIGATIADPEKPVALPPILIDLPTLHMTFRVNDGPLGGRVGKFVTSRQIGDRLERELRSDAALRVEPGETREQYRVSGRGLMHLGILIENLRREGFELCVGKPTVVERVVDGERQEPVELLVVDVPADHQSSVMALLGDRRANLIKMGQKSGATGFVHMEFSIPARSLIGLRSRMLTATQGNAIVHHTVIGFEPMRGDVPHRSSGVLIAHEPGSVTAYALDALDDRGVFFVKPGDEVYEGQIVGENCKAGDLVVNVVRGKKLTNMRASGKDDSTSTRPPRLMSLEESLEYIDDDELLEVTPAGLRVRKIMLKESDRRRVSRRAQAALSL
ncbi:GTP-binding protein TypA/BipA [Pseudobythopirellula maris]|uniref:Large ribosomal subunit assembly factor BipA n=1 Tax=Pseudobythopirellula maris TaxID=2527991 RepID=A0A5C5ZUY5_9BACT|nr:translational GTPase TypA [Pseudobythopirellula maris]TWT90721.1 GTP-binding protein TypA/BipA [Pseudobythopirellula maris]